LAAQVQLVVSHGNGFQFVFVRLLHERVQIRENPIPTWSIFRALRLSQ
jgi:hypothetical protein